MMTAAFAPYQSVKQSINVHQKAKQSAGQLSLPQVYLVTKKQ